MLPKRRENGWWSIIWEQSLAKIGTSGHFPPVHDALGLWWCLRIFTIMLINVLRPALMFQPWIFVGFELWNRNCHDSEDSVYALPMFWTSQNAGLCNEKCSQHYTLLTALESTDALWGEWSVFSQVALLPGCICICICICIFSKYALLLCSKCHFHFTAIADFSPSVDDVNQGISLNWYHLMQLPTAIL